jgi:hypothetical protein
VALGWRLSTCDDGKSDQCGVSVANAVTAQILRDQVRRQAKRLERRDVYMCRIGLGVSNGRILRLVSAEAREPH